MNNLKFGVIFLGYYRVENNRVHRITNVIMKTFSEFEDTINLKKKTFAQTYDGAMIMQRYLSGVHQMIRADFALFTIPLHCVNHQVRLSVKAMHNKDHNLVQNVTDNCYVIVKVIKYSPKRAAKLAKMKKRNGINYSKCKIN